MPSQISIRPTSKAPTSRYHLLFFITGNPGLIGYYNTFLYTLHSLLSKSSESVHPDVFHIYGQSLYGFDDHSFADSSSDQHPYSLQQQIDCVSQALVRESQKHPQDKPYDSIILMGHSVGSFILLEILARTRKSQDCTKVPASLDTRQLVINAGILLFPTILHISKSPSGQKITQLFRIPKFPLLASRLAKGLLWPIPDVALNVIVKSVTGMPADATQVTVDFLRSRIGIWSALHMAKDEMEAMTEDKWGEEIWGAEHQDASQESDVPKLVFYFGQNDHWVEDATRDYLIAARGRPAGEVANASSKPVMLIDEDGIDHGFCIRHSETVAEKTKVWVEEIIAGL